MKWRFVTAERLHICDLELRRKPKVGDVFELAHEDETELTDWEVIAIDAEFRHATCEPVDEDDEDDDDEGDDDEGDEEEAADEG